MGIVKWFKNKFAKVSAQDDEEYESDLKDRGSFPQKTVPMRRSSVDMKNAEMRTHYIKNCCEQLMECEEEVDRATMEYRLVTDYLTDIEILEKLPREIRYKINKSADKIVKIEHESLENSEKMGKISEDNYQMMGRHALEVPSDLKTMKDNEDYGDLIRSDLHKLESEKGVSRFRRNELISSANNARSMVLITIVASLCLALILMFLQLAMHYDIMLGCILAAAMAAIALAGEYMIYSNAVMELRRVEYYLTQVINKQNAIKVRFVNNSNVLEYEYRKYHVGSAAELENLYNKFLEEKRAREIVERANGEAGEEKRKLLGSLRDLHLKDPSIWLNQCKALIDPREMVEIRHELNLRRQSLRESIDYNSANRDVSKNEIDTIIKEYPEYAGDVMGIVSSYNRRVKVS